MNAPVDIGDDTPLLLAVAAEVAYADGSMTAVGLRRELRKAGIEPLLLCGKHYTTLAEIREMERRCRDAQKDQGSNTASPKRPRMVTEGKGCGLSGTEQSAQAQAAALQIVRGLSKPCKDTSPGNTPSRESATVIRPKF